MLLCCLPGQVTLRKDISYREEKTIAPKLCHCSVFSDLTPSRSPKCLSAQTQQHKVSSRFNLKFYMLCLLVQAWQANLTINLCNSKRAWMPCERTSLVVLNELAEPKTCWKQTMGLTPVVSLSRLDRRGIQAAVPHYKYGWGNVMLSDCWSPTVPVGRMVSLCPELICHDQCWDTEEETRSQKLLEYGVCVNNMQETELCFFTMCFLLPPDSNHYYSVWLPLEKKN